MPPECHLNYASRLTSPIFCRHTPSHQPVSSARRKAFHSSLDIQKPSVKLLSAPITGQQRSRSALPDCPWPPDPAPLGAHSTRRFLPAHVVAGQRATRRPASDIRPAVFLPRLRFAWIAHTSAVNPRGRITAHPGDRATSGACSAASMSSIGVVGATPYNWMLPLICVEPLNPDWRCPNVPSSPNCLP